MSDTSALGFFSYRRLQNLRLFPVSAPPWQHVATRTLNGKKVQA